MLYRYQVIRSTGHEEPQLITETVMKAAVAISAALDLLVPSAGLEEFCHKVEWSWHPDCKFSEQKAE